jgi:hypothetical protein
MGGLGKQNGGFARERMGENFGENACVGGPARTGGPFGGLPERWL